MPARVKKVEYRPICMLKMTIEHQKSGFRGLYRQNPAKSGLHKIEFLHRKSKNLKRMEKYADKKKCRGDSAPLHLAFHTKIPLHGKLIHLSAYTDLRRKRPFSKILHP